MTLKEINNVESIADLMSLKSLNSNQKSKCLKSLIELFLVNNLKIIKADRGDTFRLRINFPQKKIIIVEGENALCKYCEINNISLINQVTIFYESVFSNCDFHRFYDILDHLENDSYSNVNDALYTIGAFDCMEDDIAVSVLNKLIIDISIKIPRSKLIFEDDDADYSKVMDIGKILEDVHNKVSVNIKCHSYDIYFMDYFVDDQYYGTLQVNENYDINMMTVTYENAEDFEKLLNSYKSNDSDHPDLPF